MSSVERSPKRQRTSYDSPPYPSGDTDIAGKELPSYRLGGEHPHTPPPSVHMSPSWQSQSFSQQPTSDSGQTTIPTPPSTAGFQNHMAQRNDGVDVPSESNEHTPAQDRRDVDGDAEMGGTSESRSSLGRNAEVDVENVDAEHRRTDHERSKAEEQSDVLKSLPLFKLHTEPIVPLRPRPAENLLQLYDLTRIQGTVARRNDQGQKINKLRKSYQGKAKKLGLDGNLKATDGGRELWGLVHPGWDMEYPDGRTAFTIQHEETLLEGPSQDDLLSKLDNAFSLAPGQLPRKEHEHWREYLNMDDSAKATPAAAPAPTVQKTASSNFLARTAPAVRNSAPASPRNNVRPDRAGKKRRYDESSYSGYQEGYDDDGYSTGGDVGGARQGSASKRQKRP